MKTFRTTGTGNEQTLSEIESDKIPIYPSVQDIEDDLANLEEGQIVGTPDTGNEVAQPVDVVEKDNLHAVTSNAVSESLSYSTTEQKTGGYWIDGKPIYRRVIDYGTLPNNTSKTVDSPIDNLDYIVSLKGIAKSNEASQLPLPHAGSTFILLSFTGYTTPQKFLTATNWDARVYYAYIIVEYTKTTD